LLDSLTVMWSFLDIWLPFSPHSGEAVTMPQF
jgi:hypothetical protein